MTPTEPDQERPGEEPAADGWYLWRSEGGRGGHYATRLGTLSADQISNGHAMTLAADTPEELTALIREQDAKPQTDAGV